MSSGAPELPLFVKTFDFITWLVPTTNQFPRLHRHTITRRLLDAGLNFQESVLEANNLRGAARLECQKTADLHLDKVRIYLRLTHRLQWLSPGQYEHGSRMAAELGRLLGSWQKNTKQ